MRRPNEILVSWVSIGHAAAPLLSVLADPNSALCHRISDIYLCHREPGEGDEKTALARTRAELEALPPELRPAIHWMPWRTKARPTNHAKILEFAKITLRKVSDAHPRQRINLQLASGTKAMHAVWFMLGAGGYVPDLRLIQTSEVRFREPGEPPFQVVDAKAETWSRLIYESVRPPKSEEEDDALWDPAQVTSPAAKRVLTQVTRWACLPVPLLLVGERGTGKTTLAHGIRAASPFRRMKETWPVVVCGQFRANPDLARSELFGHAKGAFTGAHSDHVGLLERSDGDTVFLDEIADLDRQTQRLLMAAVEGRGFQRLGDGVTRSANFRLLAATNRRLDELRGRELDADFLDRVATLVLHLPPLRDRRLDLPTLWLSSLRRVGRQIRALREGSTLTPFGEALERLGGDKRVLDALALHPLPGNLRDLHRASWRSLAALAAGDSEQLVIREALSGLTDEDATPPPPNENFLPIELDAYLAQEERRLLKAAFDKAGGNKARAAELLGLARKTLEYRLLRSGLAG